MEGLIPLFYRAVKKNRIRSQYSMLSPDSTPKPKPKASSSSSSSNYNIADFYVDPPTCHVSPKPEAPNYAARTHRRFNSFGGSTADDWRRSADRSRHEAAPSQLVRFRSQRILSCLTGQSN